MSEEFKTTEKITSVEKVKDPRRVEAGKRLGMISKQAKERKLAQMREQEVEQNKASRAENDWFSNALVSSPVVGVGIAGLVGLALYFGYVKKYKTVSGKTVCGKPVSGNTVSHVKTGEDESSSEVKPKRVYKELDTLD